MIKKAIPVVILILIVACLSILGTATPLGATFPITPPIPTQPVPTQPITPPYQPTPTPTINAKRVFITSLGFTGNLGGLAGADAKCQERANAANLGGSWKAWLSSDTVSVKSRLQHYNGPYRRIDNVLVAQNWNDLVDGSLLAPINVTETGSANNAAWVWTNSFSDGSIRQSSNSSCINWTNNNDGGSTGDASRTDSGWSDYGASACYYNRPLYCIEQSKLNNQPVIQTVSLPNAKRGSNYWARINAYSPYLEDKIAILISGLPTGLQESNCTTFYRPNQKWVGCDITGRTYAPTGTYLLKATATDNHGGRTEKTFKLTVMR